MLLRQQFLSSTAAQHATSAQEQANSLRPKIGKITIEQNVQCGLNLHLKLKSPAQMGALLQTIASVKDDTHKALEDLHYVHMARFLPAWDMSALWVITTFDGAYGNGDGNSEYNDSMESYLMDFVATMGDIFTALLDFVEDAPRLPVPAYPRDFVDFIIRNNNPEVNPWTAYPEMTVIDIQSSRSIR